MLTSCPRSRSALGNASMTSTTAPARCSGGPSALLIRILIRRSVLDVFLAFLARQISLFDPFKRFIGRAQASLKLSRLNGLKNFPELWPWLKTERDQIVAAHERRRNNRFVGEFFAFAQQKFVVLEHPMTAFAIDAVKLQLFSKRWARHEPLQFRDSHLRRVFENHVLPNHFNRRLNFVA